MSKINDIKVSTMHYELVNCLTLNIVPHVENMHTFHFKFIITDYPLKLIYIFAYQFSSPTKPSPKHECMVLILDLGIITSLFIAYDENGENMYFAKIFFFSFKNHVQFLDHENHECSVYSIHFVVVADDDLNNRLTSKSSYMQCNAVLCVW